MKCTNCGTELQNGNQMKFCPYCGHQVEQTEKMPETMPGAVYGIAKGVINELGKQFSYAREHADEIEERDKKRKREELRQGLWILLVSMLLIAGIVAFGMFMQSRQEAKQNNVPASNAYIYQQLA